MQPGGLRFERQNADGSEWMANTYGFKWGEQGDQVQFIAGRTMEVIGKKNNIRSIKALDQPGFVGAKEFEITFDKSLDTSVLIRGNRFVNALTNMFQFTNAVISIYPEIPELKRQRRYFHSGIRIENNVFETFDRPLVYAKSVDGLRFSNNRIITNKEYPAFHWNHCPFLFERVINYKRSQNNFDFNFNPEKDVKTNP